MDVTVWAGSAKRQLGIRVGGENRRKYFDPRWKNVEVEIDGEVSTFSLTSGFWHHCPEFRDNGRPTIKEWLVRHKLINWTKGTPPKLILLPLGGNRFRLLMKSEELKGA